MNIKSNGPDPTPDAGMESPRRSSLRRRGGSNDGTAQTDEIPIAVSL